MQDVDRQRMKREMLDFLEDASLHKEFKVWVKNRIESKGRVNLTFGELTILHYRIFRGNDKFIYKVAAIVELFIMCYEMIEDLRNKDKKVAVYDSIVVNNEIGLMALCNKWIATIPMPEKNRLEIKQAILDHFFYCNGQHLQDAHSEMDYIESVRLKSGKLTSLASVIGSLCGTTDEKDLTTVQKYSEQIGVISQINKDLENILRTDDENDLLNWPSRTLPIHYLSQGQNQESQDVMSAIDLGEVYFEQKLPQLIEKVKCSGVIDYIKIVHKFHQLIGLSYLVELDVSDSDRRRIEDYIPTP